MNIYNTILLALKVLSICCFIECNADEKIAQATNSTKELLIQGHLRNWESHYNDMKQIDPFVMMSYDASFNRHVKRNKRSVQHEDNFYIQLQSCSFSNCSNALIGAMYLIHTRKNASEVYLCTDKKMWKISIGASECLCTNIYQHFEPFEISSMIVQSSGLYWISSNTSVLYFLNATNYNQTNIVSSVETIDYEIRDFLCNSLLKIQEVPTIIDVNESFIKLNISAIRQHQTSTYPLCKNITQSNTFYVSIFYANKLFNSCIGNSACLKQDFLKDSDEILIEDLIPETKYFMQLSLFKTSQNDSFLSLSPVFNATTSCGVSSPVSNLLCFPQSYNLVQITWNKPLLNDSRNFLYTVTVGSLEQNITSSNKTLQFEHMTTVTEMYQIKAYGLNCPTTRSLFSVANITCSPFPPLPTLNVKQVTSTTITLQWKFPQGGGVQSSTLLWTEVRSGSQTWQRSTTLPGSAEEDTITDLEPFTIYRFKIEIIYISGVNISSPSENFRTKMGVPLSPSDVEIDDSTLVWQTPLSHQTSVIQSYSVEARNRSAPKSPHIIFGGWTVVDVIGVRGKRMWLISNLTDRMWYEFRVFATNQVGQGDASLTTDPYFFLIPVEDKQERIIIIAISCAVGGIVLILVAVFVYWKYRSRKKRKGALPSHITMVHTNYDIELAQLRHMNSLAKAAANQDGRANLPADYREQLPVFPREKLTLGSQLGRGNFGEVYKGIAIDIKGSESGIETAVAVKTLKETASEHEQREFLMEAYFMNLFDHPNILSLLGVCLDNEPQFIILELMEGGDLLKYLRGARSSPEERSPKLGIPDLVDISIDLAAGCQYLESRHFIHRDLAARNCLVSTKLYDSSNRVVKIGDFGLARDIYKNDYYHKEGDGQLPVRWMAPETITLQRYTVQSDVWSFGVVVWEVMTLGQQPFSVYNNSEAFELVRDGQRLGRPDGCPVILYTLMLRCWNLEPSNRPTFEEIFNILQNFKEQHMLSSLNRGVVRLRSGPITYAPIHSQDDADAVFIKDSAHFFENHAFTFDEGEYTPSTAQSLDDGCSPTDEVISHDDVIMTSASNSEGFTPVPTLADRSNFDNYARLQFAPSRETSIKNALPN